MFLALPGRELAEAGGLHEPTSPGSCSRCGHTRVEYTLRNNNNINNNNNNNTIWGGSVFTGEERPPNSGELKHALTQAGGPTQSQLSRPMSSGHHISMEHRLRRKQLNSDTNASNKKKRNTRKKKRRNFFFFGKNGKKKMKNFLKIKK